MEEDKLVKRTNNVLSVISIFFFILITLLFNARIIHLGDALFYSFVLSVIGFINLLFSISNNRHWINIIISIFTMCSLLIMYFMALSQLH